MYFSFHFISNKFFSQSIAYFTEYEFIIGLNKKRKYFYDFWIRDQKIRITLFQYVLNNFEDFLTIKVCSLVNHQAIHNKNSSKITQKRVKIMQSFKSNNSEKKYLKWVSLHK